jgi:NAD(P)-dependent dehydrogenase (short-subunit alcohol dehydrogenase family)
MRKAALHVAVPPSGTVGSSLVFPVPEVTFTCYDTVENGEAIVKTAMDAFGRVDIVVNNAGIVTPEVWADLTLESWQRTFDVNTTGVFAIMKAVWPIFVEQKYGRCICVASPAIFGAGVAAYSASKIACIGKPPSISLCLLLFLFAPLPFSVCPHSKDSRRWFV